MNEELENWTDWLPFPDPRKKMFFTIPFGPGVYEIKRADTNEFILRGSGKNCGFRMSSLLPSPLGTGTRRNTGKRNYVLENIDKLVYRCIAFDSEEKARNFEQNRHREEICLFPT